VGSVTHFSARFFDAGDMGKQGKTVVAVVILPLLLGSAPVLAGTRTRGGSGASRPGETADAVANTSAPATEAPAAFDDGSNGLVDDTTHSADRAVFDEVEGADQGLGPLYNAQSCRECHQSPVSGAASQVTELRVGHTDRSGNFENPDIAIGDGAEVVHARSLVNDRSICPSAEFPKKNGQERAPASETIRALRASLNTLGDGFVEAVPSSTLRAIAQQQCQSTDGAVCGKVVSVPVAEASGATRAGRFGWKDQQASLLSFSADAYLNEMGVTSALQPTEVAQLCDAIQDPEDQVGSDGLGDIDRFARFMRASKAPPRDSALANSPEGMAGSDLFDQIGCATCHVRTLVTAPAGSVLNGGTLTVSDAVGNKIIHPFGDFLLHDVGTGDGIVQNGGQSTANLLRTAPLWGLHVRGRLMHDLRSLTFDDAISRHQGEARGAVARFHSLGNDDKRRLYTFLGSL
jgi:CxxC motif-containing protein (DUF1111 family)